MLGRGNLYSRLLSSGEVSAAPLWRGAFREWYFLSSITSAVRRGGEGVNEAREAWAVTAGSLL